MLPLRALSCCLALALGWTVLDAASAQDKKTDDKDKKSEKKQEKKKAEVYTDAKEAGPDFLIQGEYVGAFPDKGKYAAQVVAKGDGKFEVYLLEGGLPGAGWDGKTRIKLQAVTVDGKVELKGKDLSGVFDGDVLSGRDAKDQAFGMKRTERKSPTLGLAPPQGAVVLFDGASPAEWNGGKLVEGNLLFCGVTSKQKIGAGKFHIEFRTPFQPRAGGQGRGNSGVYLHGREIQVLDSFGLEGRSDECGGFYGSAKPRVNMCLPPLSWQTYDVEMKTSDEDLLVTVQHNGVLVHENYVFKGSAGKTATINLQNHGNPVVYRNIWFLPEKK